MNPGLVNRLNPPLRKQALAFIFLCGFGFARIKVTLARFVWISMKTSNPLLCNIPYFNNFNNYCFLFLIKSLETETLERDQNSGVWYGGKQEEKFAYRINIRSWLWSTWILILWTFIVPMLWTRAWMLEITDLQTVPLQTCLFGIQLRCLGLHSDNSINSIPIFSWWCGQQALAFRVKSRPPWLYLTALTSEIGTDG